MRTTVVGLAGALLLTMTSLAAARQLPVTMTVARDVVAPGAPVTVTVVGPPLQSFAVLGSSVGAGLSNTALFSLIGTTYGGNGVTNYALPDLRAAAPNGLTYTICDVGVFPSSR